MIEKQVKISEIKRNPANPRVIRDEKYTKLLNSLLVFPKMLQARPIVVDKKMVVLGGNMRLKALQEIATFDNDELYARLQKINEWKEKDQSEQTEIFDFWIDFATTKKLNVAVADDFTDKEASAFIIKDNNNFGDWDYDLLNNWDSELLEDWGVELDFAIEEEEKEVVEDEIPENVETRCKLGDIWQLGNHRLICGDSTDIAVIDRLMDGVKTDMVFTDPPYGMNLDTDYSKMEGNGRKGKTYSKVIGDNEDFKDDLIKTVFDNFNYCKEIFLWGVDYYFDLIPNFKDGNLIVWDKTLQTNGDAGYNSEFELLWSKNQHKKEVIHFNWFRYFGLSSQDMKTREHPTQKPLQVITPFIEKYSKENDLIVDIYGGSGSTLIACEQLNRKCYMCELDEHYCDVIIQRWENFTNKKATKIK